MSESAADLSRRFYEEVWNQKREEAITRLVQPDCYGRRATGSEFNGLAAFRDEFFRPFVAAIPDLQIEIEDVISEGDHAVVRWRAAGTHLGGGLGMTPSGKRVETRGITWFTFRDGKIAAGWDCWDQTGFLQRLAEGVTA